MGIIAQFIDPFRRRRNVSLVRTRGTESERDWEIKQEAAADVAAIEEDDKFFDPDAPANQDELLSRVRTPQPASEWRLCPGKREDRHGR